MSRQVRLVSIVLVSVLSVAIVAARQARPAAPAAIDVTVQEGTSMSVSVSPDGRMLATDLQGGIWTVPVAGGAARRVTGIYDDARQPTWSPDGKWITYFAYQDGGYDIWAVAPDGTGLHRLTWGPFDDREPVWSHDGTRVAFSSDRGNPLGSDYNIWILDTRSGELRQLTKNAAEDSMPSWSPDDREIAFASTREGGQSIWAVSVADLTERKLATVTGARLDAPSWGPGGQVVYHATAAGSSRYELDGQAMTGTENVFAFRASWASPNEFFYVSDGKIRRRATGTATAQTVAFSATLQVTQPQYTRRVRDFTSTAPRKALGIVRPVISPDGSQIAFAAVGDIYVVPATGGKPINLTNDSALDTDPSWSPDGGSLVYSSDKTSPLLQLWIRDMKSGQARQGHLARDTAAGRFVLARWQEGGLLQRRRHVARRADVDPRRGHRHGDEDPRHAAAARRASLVAGWRTGGTCRRGAAQHALPRRHQPDPDDLHDRRRRRVAHADADDGD